MKKFKILIPNTLKNEIEIEALKLRTDILTILDVVQSEIVNEQNEVVEEVFVIECETTEESYLKVKEIMKFEECTIENELYLM